MISYNNYQLTEEQINIIKRINAKLNIAKYIKEYGMEPNNLEPFYNVTNEQLENFKRLAYANYMVVDNSQPPVPEPDDTLRWEVQVINNKLSVVGMKNGETVYEWIDEGDTGIDVDDYMVFDPEQVEIVDKWVI